MNSEKLDLDSEIAKLVVENANRFRRKTARREYVDISRKLFESKIGKYSGYLDWGGEDYPQAYFVWLNFPETLKVDTGDWKYDGMVISSLSLYQIKSLLEARGMDKAADIIQHPVESAP